MNLKTLKEMNKDPCRYETRSICEGCLRQEAIKWLKADLELVKGNVLLGIEKKIAERFITRWKYRFNITEGDLYE